MTLFYAISLISIKKSFEGEKLGLSYEGIATGIIVRKVKEGGLLSNTIVQEGQTITSVNGISLAGLDLKEVVEILSSLTHHVNLEVWTPIQYTRNEVPVFLSEATSSPVPLSKWQMIYDSVNNEMLPAIDKFDETEKRLGELMDRYIHRSKTDHKDKATDMERQAAAASNNATLMSTNALYTANSMLCSHGIAVKLGFSQQKIEKFYYRFATIHVTNRYNKNSLVAIKTPRNFGFLLFN